MESEIRLGFGVWSEARLGVKNGDLERNGLLRGVQSGGIAFAVPTDAV